MIPVRIFCPGKRKYSEKRTPESKTTDCCNRTFFFVSPEDEITKIIIVCPSCGNHYKITKSKDQGTTLTELDKTQKIEYEQNLEVVLNGHW